MIEDIEPGMTVTVICDNLHSVSTDPEPDPGIEHTEVKRKKVKLVGKTGTDDD
jgi:hypothetical protein